MFPKTRYGSNLDFIFLDHVTIIIGMTHLMILMTVKFSSHNTQHNQFSASASFSLVFMPSHTGPIFNVPHEPSARVLKLPTMLIVFQRSLAILLHYSGRELLLLKSALDNKCIVRRFGAVECLS